MAACVLPPPQVLDAYKKTMQDERRRVSSLCALYVRVYHVARNCYIHTANKLQLRLSEDGVLMLSTVSQVRFSATAAEFKYAGTHVYRNSGVLKELHVVK